MHTNSKPGFVRSAVQPNSLIYFGEGFLHVSFSSCGHPRIKKNFSIELVCSTKKKPSTLRSIQYVLAWQPLIPIVIRFLLIKMGSARSYLDTHLNAFLSPNLWFFFHCQFVGAERFLRNNVWHVQFPCLFQISLALHTFIWFLPLECTDKIGPWTYACTSLHSNFKALTHLDQK